MLKLPRLEPSNILFVCIDLQRKLLDAIPDVRGVLEANVVLLKTARILGIPSIVTTQYKKGLGELAGEIAELAGSNVLDKTAFSCGGDPQFQSEMERQERDWFVLSGVETHICVLQTALDLMRAGKNVAVVADAVAARRSRDHELGLNRMQSSGALIVTKEMLVYELLGRSDVPAFKQILPLIKN
jgi:nicotinamidase-related amidase